MALFGSGFWGLLLGWRIREGIGNFCRASDGLAGIVACLGLLQDAGMQAVVGISVFRTLSVIGWHLRVCMVEGSGLGVTGVAAHLYSPLNLQF